MKSVSNLAGDCSSKEERGKSADSSAGCAKILARAGSPEISFEHTYGFGILGFAQANGSEPRYVFRVGGDIIALRGNAVTSIAGLALLNPDLRRWRELFPRRGGRVDVQQAAAALIGEARKMGRYELPPELAPRAVGRPKTS